MKPPGGLQSTSGSSPSGLNQSCAKASYSFVSDKPLGDFGQRQILIPRVWVGLETLICNQVMLMLLIRGFYLEQLQSRVQPRLRTTALGRQFNCDASQSFLLGFKILLIRISYRCPGTYLKSKQWPSFPLCSHPIEPLPSMESNVILSRGIHAYASIDVWVCLFF